MREIRRAYFDQSFEETQLRILKARFVPKTRGYSIAVPVEDWSILRGTMLSIHFETETTHHILGSAVLVAPGIAISASHIFQSVDGLPNDYEHINLLGHDGDDTLVWDVSSVFFIDTTDLCIICMEVASELPSSGVIRIAGMTDRLPDIGEELFLAGFRAEALTTEIVDNVRDCTGNVLCCAGQVRALYPEGRDKCMLPFPVIEADFAAPGGVSGGPAFDKDGRLIGVLTSSLDEPPAYISMIWPALNAQFAHLHDNCFLRPDQILRDLC